MAIQPLPWVERSLLTRLHPHHATYSPAPAPRSRQLLLHLSNSIPHKCHIDVTGKSVTLWNWLSCSAYSLEVCPGAVCMGGFIADSYSMCGRPQGLPWSPEGHLVGFCFRLWHPKVPWIWGLVSLAYLPGTAGTGCNGKCRGSFLETVRLSRGLLYSSSQQKCIVS
jgi:hypothetical protein